MGAVNLQAGATVGSSCPFLPVPLAFSVAGVRGEQNQARSGSATMTGRPFDGADHSAGPAQWPRTDWVTGAQSGPFNTNCTRD